ncbi:hypothetical protein [Bradyrhizobium sp. 930_D9_N1_4]|uniref:hypothetical protein n=1 Tax=Bradyrhizobium sp. 930_D9_N1_4 TaxID=3240374 RepID=UPI003F889930
MRAKILLGCYRTGDANDPETYVAAITAILARYPQDVITAVTHPATGLPSKKGWLPTVKEVVEACDEANEPTIQNELRLKRIKEQLEAREREDKGERPTLAQLKEKYGNNWGIEDPEDAKRVVKPAPTAEQLRHHYQHYDLAFKPKNQGELEEQIDRGVSPSSV